MQPVLSRSNGQQFRVVLGAMAKFLECFHISKNMGLVFPRTLYENMRSQILFTRLHSIQSANHFLPLLLFSTTRFCLASALGKMRLHSWKSGLRARKTN